jgi:DNA-binding XRE family transcriptional regulator
MTLPGPQTTASKHRQSQLVFDWWREQALANASTHPLRRARYERGLSQAALADAAGVHRDTISKYEHGKRPSKHRQFVIAQVLGSSAERLFQ